MFRRRLVLLTLSHLACSAAPAQRCPEAPVQTPPAPVQPAVSPVVAEPAAPPTLERFEVVADDGHALAVWAKVPAEPTGAIVLVHGRTWSARPDFDLQVAGESRSSMDSLAAAGLATYALDLRGYGETTRDDTGWNTPDRATDDLIAVLAWATERHRGQAPALLGWSLGSLTAQLAAQRRPELISSLILYGYPRSPDRRYTAEPSGVAPAKADTTAESAASDFIIPGNISQAAIDAFVQQALAADPVRSDWNRSDQWNALNPSAITVPTLVLHGAKDPYAPLDNLAKLYQRLGAEDRAWVTLEGGDHAAHLEDAGPRFIDAVLDFVEAPR